MATGRSFRDRRRLWYGLVDGPAAERLRERATTRGARRAVRDGDRRVGGRRVTESRRAAPQGRLWLVGAGPGDPDLLTVAARRLLDEADVVVHDRLVGDAILATIPPGRRASTSARRATRAARTRREINRRLADLVRSGHDVVRLKGGDPFVFGRGGGGAAGARRRGHRGPGRPRDHRRASPGRPRSGSRSRTAGSRAASPSSPVAPRRARPRGARLGRAGRASTPSSSTWAAGRRRRSPPRLLDGGTRAVDARSP